MLAQSTRHDVRPSASTDHRYTVIVPNILYEIAWTVYVNGKPRVTSRQTDKEGLERFAKKHGIEITQG